MLQSLPSGSWEVLPEPQKKRTSEYFGRLSKEGHFDCVVVFDRENSKIIVAKSRIVWSGHSPSAVPGTTTRTFRLGNEFEVVTSESFAAAVDKAGAMTRKDWRRCSSCSERMPYGLMADVRTCMGCATENLGMVF